MRNPEEQLEYIMTLESELKASQDEVSRLESNNKKVLHFIKCNNTHNGHYFNVLFDRIEKQLTNKQASETKGEG